MYTLSKAPRTSWVLTLAALAVLGAGGVEAQVRIDGITGPAFSLTARAGEISTPEGGSIHFWGYADTTGAANAGLSQYPGPTLIVTQNDVVTIELTSQLPFGQPVSMIFPGHRVVATGGSAGLLTRESIGPADVVTYTFTATAPGTYMYHSGTRPELQIEMGLVGAIIVRPVGHEDRVYEHWETRFDHEFLFLVTSLDPILHQLAEQGRFSEIDMTTYWPVYWFINGRAAPDTMAAAFVPWLPHQPYDCMPRLHPGERLLMRLIGAGQGQHPFHFHGNNAEVVGRDGRMLSSNPVNGPDLRVSHFTTLTVPGETIDQIFTWTGEGLNWDVYGPVDQGCTDADHDMRNDADPALLCHDDNCVDTVDNETGAPGADGFDDGNYEYCPDHGKDFPVVLPEAQNLAFGGWWSGSPFMGEAEALPPGEGGLNPSAGFFFMWHSHAEKEMTNFDVFPGGMMTMMVVEPPGTMIH